MWIFILSKCRDHPHAKFIINGKIRYLYNAQLDFGEIIIPFTPVKCFIKVLMFKFLGFSYVNLQTILSQIENTNFYYNVKEITSTPDLIINNQQQVHVAFVPSENFFNESLDLNWLLIPTGQSQISFIQWQENPALYLIQFIKFINKTLQSENIGEILSSFITTLFYKTTSIICTFSNLDTLRQELMPTVFDLVTSLKFIAFISNDKNVKY